MLGQLGADRGGQDHSTPAACGLELAGQLLEYDELVDVDVLGLERLHLAPAQAPKRGDQDPRPVPGVDGVGEGFNLGGGQEVDLGLGDPGRVDGQHRVGRQVPAAHSGVAQALEGPVMAVHGRGGVVPHLSG